MAESSNPLANPSAERERTASLHNRISGKPDDPLAYSFVPNLVWLPSEVAKLTDRQDSFVQRYVQAISTRLYRDYPGYRFREAALNPTNPLNRAVDWERTLIERYRDGSARGDHVSVTEDLSGRTLHVARPMTVDDAACLRCHGDPAHAPAAMRALYPGNGGFNWRLGETVGAQIVSVPFEVQTRRSRTS